MPSALRFSQVANPTAEDWERLKAGVANALSGASKDETLTYESICEAIKVNKYVWMHGVNPGVADAVLHITNEDGKGVLNIAVLFGSHMAEWQDEVLAMCERVAKHNNCVRLRWVTYKPGMAKLYSRLHIFEGWTNMFMFEKEINHV